MNWLLSLFLTPKPYDMALRELRISKAQLMGIESDLELFSAHREMLAKRISRLESFMDEDSKPRIVITTHSLGVDHAV